MNEIQQKNYYRYVKRFTQLGNGPKILSKDISIEKKADAKAVRTFEQSVSLATNTNIAKGVEETNRDKSRSYKPFRGQSIWISERERH